MVTLVWLVSWFYSQERVDTALVCVAIFGAIIESAVAVAAVINVHKEMPQHRKEKLEKYIETFACVAAFLFLAEAILGYRSSALLGIRIEELRKNNDIVEAELQATKKQLPQNLPIHDISAEARIKALLGKRPQPLKDKYPANFFRYDGPWRATVQFIGKDGMTPVFGRENNFLCDTLVFVRQEKAGSGAPPIGLDLQFRMELNDLSIWTGFGNATASQWLNAVEYFDILPNAIPDNPKLDIVGEP